MQYNRLHAKYVAGILKEATIRLKRLPNLNQASTAISKQVTICGDLHGKLDDLLVVFHKVSNIYHAFIYRFNVFCAPRTNPHVQQKFCVHLKKQLGIKKYTQQCCMIGLILAYQRTLPNGVSLIQLERPKVKVTNN